MRKMQALGEAHTNDFGREGHDLKEGPSQPEGPVTATKEPLTLRKDPSRRRKAYQIGCQKASRHHRRTPE